MALVLVLIHYVFIIFIFLFRGMFTLGTRSPMISETVNIPPLEMNGKASQGCVFCFILFLFVLVVR